MTEAKSTLVETRYRVGEPQMGSPYFGDCFSGYDEEAERRVLLQRIPPHVLSFIGHEQIVLRTRLFQNATPMMPVLDVYPSTDGTYIVYEAMEGALPLLQYIKGKPLTLVLEVLKDVCHAVATLHEDTLWHGGLVPEFIWVLPCGEVRLLTMFTDSPLSVYNACGSGQEIHFFAPETMTMSPLDARTDIYNLGVLLYLVLTGSFPFGDEAETLHPPSQFNEHIPPQLDRLILKMINGKPTARYQWIGQVVDELRRVLGNHDILCPIEGRTYGSQQLFSAEFTGRVEETKRLSQFYEEMVEGERRTLLLTGMSGVGRKRLVYEVSGRYMHSVSSISATVRDYSYWVVEDIAMKLFKLCFAVPRLEKIGKLYVNLLSRVLPRIGYEYRDLLNPVREGDMDKVEPDGLLFDFFTEVIETYGEPMVFELYDAHLLDSDSSNFFKRLLQRETMVFGLIGVSEKSTPALKSLFQEQLHLEPLSSQELREVVLSRLGDADFLNADFIQWISHHSQGSLEKAFHLLEYLSDTKQIYMLRYVWHMVPESVEKLNIPESLESLILYRLEQLPDKAKELCQLLALFKGSFVFEAIAKVAHVNSLTEVLQLLKQLEDQGLLLQNNNLYRFPSNNVKNHIAESISGEERADLHRRLAHGLMETGTTEYMEIAHHFECGDELAQAIYFYLLGARRCYIRNLLVDAEWQGRKAMELYDRLGRPCPNSLLNFRARVLRMLGSLEEAASAYKELYERTGTLRSLTTLNLTYVNMGHFHSIKPYVPLIEAQLSGNELRARQRLYLMVVLGMYFIEVDGNYEYTSVMEEFQERNGAELRRQLPVRDYISWLYNLQVLLTNVPNVRWEKRARYLHEAASLAEHHNLRQILVGIYNCMAIGLQETEPLKAKDYYLQSAKLASDLGDKSKEAIAYINLVEIYRLLGDMYHSYSYIVKARDTGEAVFKDDNTLLLQNEIEHFMFIEDYTKAHQVIDALIKASKRTGRKKMRDYAFLNRFNCFVEQGELHKCDRMWPIVERICTNRKMENDRQILGAKYQLAKGDPSKVVDLFMSMYDQQETPTEVRIKRSLLLIEGLLDTGRWHEALEVAQSLQKLIHKTGYVGYLARAHFYLGRLYQLTHQFVHANLNYKRAMMGFRKLNQQTRLGEIDKLMRQTNQEMVRVADAIIDKMQQETEHLDEDASMKIADGGVRLKEWAQTIAFERQEMVDTLTDNEILLDAIRRVSSSIMVKTVCENVASVAFENLLFDQMHLYIRISPDRVEEIHLNEQLQALSSVDSDVDNMISTVIAQEKPYEQEGRGSYFYGLPVFSHDQQVIAVMVLEKLSLQTPFTVRDKRFINSFAQLVSSNVENAIMYEVMITDNLTGLYQRNYFQKRLQEEFNKCTRYGVDLSFLMLDLDNFSLVNNRYGHNEGDRVLRAVAQTLMRSVRNVDICGRFGGEEMIVILPNTNGHAAKIVAERILQSLRNIPIEGNRYQITASIGVASVDMDKPVDPLDLIEKADQAETFAKRTGKNRIVCHWEMGGGQ
ncbi:MAG TPA: diguanylate cyclase [Bacilli bacterium]|nr:diguanylate cyclase [Bacilli bacterium]